MVDWTRQKKGKYIFCQRRGIASQTRQDDIAIKLTVASSTSIADSLSHIVASRTYIVACAVLDGSSAGSRRGLFHPIGYIEAFEAGPSGQAEQGEKVRFLSPALPRVSSLSRPRFGPELQTRPAGSLSARCSPATSLRREALG